jgi:hypothetical protein
MEAVLCLGYVFLFGGSVPFVIVIACITMVIKLRMDAYKFTRLLRRPRPIASSGIGAWGTIVYWLGWLGIVVTVGTPVLNLKIFEQHFPTDENKLAVFFIIEHVAVAIKLAISAAIDNKPGDAKMMAARHDYIKKRLLTGSVEGEDMEQELKKEKCVPMEKDGTLHVRPLDGKVPEWDNVEKVGYFYLLGGIDGGKDKLPDEADLTHDREMFV